MTSRPVSRIVTSIGLIALLSGCEQEAAECSPCGTAIVALGAEPDALLPPVVHTQPGELASDLLFQKLADIGPSLNTIGDAGFQPRLARSWKIEDSLTISFELDPRAKWQDGVPVTAADVAFAFSVYRNPVIGANARSLLALISSVTARDERTAVFRFSKPYPEQFYDATYSMRIIPKHMLDTVPISRLESHPFVRAPMVGNGPYRFVQWKAGASVQFAADTTFFLGRPGLSNVVFNIASDVNTARALILADQADLLNPIGTKDDVPQVTALPQFRVELRQSASFNYLAFNLHARKSRTRPHQVLGDREVRRAITLGVDRPALIERMFGSDYARVPVGPLSRMTQLGNDSTIPQLAYDTLRARTTLETAGWRDTDGDGVRERNGVKLQFEIIHPSSSNNRIRTVEILRDNLARIGVRVIAKPVEFNSMRAAIPSGDFDAMFINWGEDPSPSGLRQIFTTSAIGESNVGGYSSPEFDNLVEQAIATRDSGAARARWREALATVNGDAPGIWLYSPLEPTAIHRRYENVTTPPQQWLSTLWTWRVAAGQMIPRDRITPAPASP